MIFLKKHGISILLSFMILIACFMNTEPLPIAPMNNFDKGIHFFMFFLLSGCIYFENTNYFKKRITYQRIMWGSLFFPVFYGGMVEIIQNYVSPYRVGDWGDFLWDSVGAFIAFAIALKINTKLTVE